MNLNDVAQGCMHTGTVSLYFKLDVNQNGTHKCAFVEAVRVYINTVPFSVYAF